MKVYYLTVCYKVDNPETLGYRGTYRYLDKEAAQRVYKKYQQNSDIEWVELKEEEEDDSI